MKKPKAEWLDRTLIESPLHLCLCVSEVEFHGVLKSLKIPKETWPEWIPEGKDGVVHKINGPSDCCIVCIKKGRELSVVSGLLTHEAVHVWQEICKDMNEYEPSREFEAYSIQMLSMVLIDSYRKKVTKVRA